MSECSDSSDSSDSRDSSDSCVSIDKTYSIDSYDGCDPRKENGIKNLFQTKNLIFF